ncbi:LysR family transcriptional regulator [Sutterella sp.]|uniref:LysR family transcriptional regulator n=1 Tax=Sutterella sp. TaxID=1981025 RepID=UPI0026DECA82|nr:LysR family transcriptional regulator [Sutterella sp.]MDO5531205.1 LysR family transcriptional regulator [Sutterella sp.]
MLTKYRALIAAVDTGSLTRAAKSCFCTQSAASRMILDLERDLGIRLLDRGRRGVVPTDDCLRLLPRIRRLCAEDAAVKAEAASIRGVETGSVRIGAISSIATFWLPPVIAAFGRAHPGIEFEILMGDYTEIERWVTEGRVDFGFVAEPTAGKFAALPLHDDRLLAILPESHPLAEQPTVRPEELAREPFILLEKGRDAEISRLFEERNLTPDVRFRTFDDYALLAMVEAGIGTGILPELILGRLNYRVAVRHVSGLPRRRLLLIAEPGAMLGAATRTFLEVFGEELRGKLSLDPDVPAFLRALTKE